MSVDPRHGSGEIVILKLVRVAEPHVLVPTMLKLIMQSIVTAATCKTVISLL